MLLVVRVSSYGCTWEVWRARSQNCILTHLSCSPNFPRASITRYTHAKHEQILKCLIPYLTLAALYLLSIYVHFPRQFFLKFLWNKIVLGKIDCCAMFACNNDRQFREIYGESPQQFLRRKTRNTFLVFQGPKALGYLGKTTEAEGI